MSDAKVRRIHISVHKRYLLRVVEEKGPTALSDFEGTMEEALHAIRMDPRSFFTIGACDNERPDGTCGGHDAEVAT